MRWVGVSTGVSALATATYYGIAEGRHSAIGAAVGGLVVVAFFLTGVALSTLSTRPGQADGAVLLMAMMGYGAQVIGLFVVMLVFRRTTLFDHRAFGIAILIGTVVALAASVTGFVRAKIPTIVPDEAAFPRDSHDDSSLLQDRL
jgi:ATP synthase protein I